MISKKKNKGFQTLHNFSFAQCPMTKYSKAKIQFVHSWHSFETATIRVTVKSSSFLLRFLSANGKISSCEKTIFMKKVGVSFREVVMVQRLRGQDLLFGGAEPLDFAPSSNKISDYWGGSCPPCPPYNYLTGFIQWSVTMKTISFSLSSLLASLHYKVNKGGRNSEVLSELLRRCL